MLQEGEVSIIAGHLDHSIRKIILTIFVLLLVSLVSPNILFASGKLPCPCASYNRELYETKPRMQGEDVWELQNRLKQLGLFKGTCDGIYGKKTAAAVRSFQKARKQPVTGKVVEATWEALGEGCEPVSTPPAEPPEYVSILIDLEKLTLTIMEGNHPFKQFPVAIGKPSTPSPIGEWKITSKEYDKGGAFGARWMGLNVPWGDYGIHGTNRPWSIGSTASAGCIRMFNEDVVQVFEWATVGTRVKIKAPLTWLAGSCNRTLKDGVCGPDVVYAQLLLKETGFNPYYCDGWYGALTELAVQTYQLHTGLTVTGKVDEETRHHLEEKAGIFETQNQH